MIVTESDFNEWIQHPMTLEFRKALRKHRERIKEDLICGRYENPDIAFGMAKALDDMSRITYMDLMDELSEGD